MNEKFNLEIKNFGRINEANIEINKLNVVGGINASGKSTAAKLLYCFLKAISVNHEKYVLPIIIKDLNRLIKYVDNSNGEYYKIPDRLESDASRFDVLKVFHDYEDKLKELKSAMDNSQYEYRIYESIEPLLEGLENNENIIYSYIVSSLLYGESLTKFVYEDPTSGIHVLDGVVRFYSDSFESKIHNDVEVVVSDGNNIDIGAETDFDFDDNDFYYLSNGSVNEIKDVFYMGNVSIFDLDNYMNLPQNSNEMPDFNYEEHTAYLISNCSGKNPEYYFSEKGYNLQKRIENIIEGNFESDFFLYEFSFSQEDKKDILPVNISSGIKQIGIVQLLLKNNKLTPGTFLIIDEPEVNLHPKWQFKFAEILVLLAKELDITIYLNSHSPTFIESIDAFAGFYDMGGDVNYYLTEESGDKYNFTKVDSNELYKIYSNLGDIYDEINKLKIRKKLISRS